MSIRHESRKILMQSMYELDSTDQIFGSIEHFREVLDRSILSAGQELGKDRFVYNLADIVKERLLTIDEIIKKAAPEWPIEKISVVDRNVLRIGLSELLFGDKINVPPKVAIDEAIEIAKEFGGETSGRFVNGVMGAVYKELGEPGKDSKKKQSNDQIKTESKAGAFVFAAYQGDYYAAMILDVFGYWTLSKGSIEDGENAEDCAKREAKEELGIEVTITQGIGSNNYIAHNPGNHKINKSIIYFLAKADYQEIKLGDSNGLIDAKWHKIKDIKDLKTYKDMSEIIDKATSIITSTDNDNI